jgi:hypothetical protein
MFRSTRKEKNTNREQLKPKLNAINYNLENILIIANHSKKLWEEEQTVCQIQWIEIKRAKVTHKKLEVRLLLMTKRIINNLVITKKVKINKNR